MNDLQFLLKFIILPKTKSDKLNVDPNLNHVERPRHRMFLNALNTLVSEQRSRLCRVCDEDRIDEAFAVLKNQNLDTESINRDCMRELNEILLRRNDTITSGSTRLNKYGWSTSKIRDHMNRFLQSKMRAAANILKVAVTDRNASLEDSIRGVLFFRERPSRDDSDDEAFDDPTVQRGLKGHDMASDLIFE